MDSVVAGQLVTERALDLPGAARLLADWGFLAEPDLPDRPGPAHLLVALRDAPTFKHYDPELVEYWVTVGGRGARRTLDRHTRLPIEQEFSWGWIRITDRLGVTNEYVSFGGHLSAAEVDGMTVAMFVSPVPLLRRGGHSQGWDHGAASLAAFFGRLIVAVDFTPGFEARAAAVDPATRYAAFIDDLVRRYRRAPALRDQHAELWMLIQSEARRLQRDYPTEWTAGIDLARSLNPS
jgi:hypothetical protein